MDYQEECRLKAERVRQALNRLGGEALEEVPILPAPEIFHYRNKAQYPVAPGKGRAVAGFYRAGTHQVVACPQCGIFAAGDGRRPGCSGGLHESVPGKLL